MSPHRKLHYGRSLYQQAGQVNKWTSGRSPALCSGKKAQMMNVEMTSYPWDLAAEGWGWSYRGGA